MKTKKAIGIELVRRLWLCRWPWLGTRRVRSRCSRAAAGVYACHICAGAVPLEWYNEYDHIGYDVYGKKIVRQVKGDQLDEFIARKDDPNKW